MHIILYMHYYTCICMYVCHVCMHIKYWHISTRDCMPRCPDAKTQFTPLSKGCSYCSSRWDNHRSQTDDAIKTENASTTSHSRWNYRAVFEHVFGIIVLVCDFNMPKSTNALQLYAYISISFPMMHNWHFIFAFGEVCIRNGLLFWMGSI